MNNIQSRWIINVVELHWYFKIRIYFIERRYNDDIASAKWKWNYCCYLCSIDTVKHRWRVRIINYRVDNFRVCSGLGSIWELLQFKWKSHRATQTSLELNYIYLKLLMKTWTFQRERECEHSRVKSRRPCAQIHFANQLCPRDDSANLAECKSPSDIYQPVSTRTTMCVCRVIDSLILSQLQF